MRVLGVDYGSRRIGIALSDPTGLLAQPFDVLEGFDETAIGKIIAIVNDQNVDIIVVGLPKSLRGDIGAQAQEVLEFTEKLRSKVDIPVTTWDERLSTAFAERALLESKMRRGDRKNVVDKVAAAVMLQGYLDSKRMEET